MTKDELKIAIAKCFRGRECSVEFDPHGHYGWLVLRCSCCVFPEEIDSLRKVLYVSNICASINYDSKPYLPYIEIDCSYQDSLK